jgi:hypothetical protein
VEISTTRVVVAARSRAALSCSSAVFSRSIFSIHYYFSLDYFNG